MLARSIFSEVNPGYSLFRWKSNEYLEFSSGYWSGLNKQFQSSDGGKLKASPDQTREYTVAAGSTRLVPGTVNKMQKGWNWIGYWLPNSQKCDVAFGEHYSKVDKFKSEFWFVYREGI